jgi:RND superfamily putative drug exporter
VLFSVAASVTFMPAILAVLGNRINSIPVIRLHEAHDGRLWKGWTRVVLRRPWVSILVAVTLIALIAGPAVAMKTQMTSAASLPEKAESRQGLEILDQEFDREALSPTLVLLTWEGDEKIDMSRAASLFMYGQQISSLTGVASVQSPFTIAGLSDPTALAALWTQFEQLLNDPDGFAVPEEGITLDSGQTITAEELEQFKQLIKATVAPGAVLYRVVAGDDLTTIETDDLVGRLMRSDPPEGYTSHVGGEAAFSYDFAEELNTWFPWVIVWVVFTTFIVFVVLLRSVVLPVLAVVLNLATIAMSFGILVLIFQGETFESVFRFTATGAIDAVDRVLMLCILFGITMDYAVFMLTRMHERWLRTGDSRESVTVGLVRTARIIVSAALLVVIVTGAFAFTSIGTTKTLGVGIALAIIADTLLVRLVLLPAVMAYLGKTSWWWPLFRRRKEG